jgi:hypothetical protein
MDTTKRPDGLHLYLAAAPSTARHGLMALDKQDAQPAKFLLSYHYFKKMDLDELVAGMGTKPMLFADSGAYSAWTQGAEVKVKEYAQWLKRWEHLLSVYVNLDVIRDAEATASNQRLLEREGLQPIPVFHTGSDMTVLDGLAKEYPYIALGGMVGSPGAACLRWSAACMKRTQDQGTVFHGFGQTRKALIESLPWYSVDSSSWGSGHRFGAVDLWTGRQFVKVRVGDSKSVYKYAADIRRLGVDPACIADRGRYHQKYAIRISAASWHDYEAHLRRRHGAVPCQERSNGLHLYLVDGAKDNLQEAAKTIAK